MEFIPVTYKPFKQVQNRVSAGTCCMACDAQKQHNKTSDTADTDTKVSYLAGGIG